MPGSWERSRVSDIDSSLDANPPEPAAPEGFLLSEAQAHFENIPAHAGTGDPDPGARARWRVPESAGPAGGNEAQAGHRWQSEPQGVRDMRRGSERREEICV
jgi:hypothetical protein